MLSKIKRFINKAKSFPWIILGYARPSYAQMGEDRILEYLFKELKIDKPTYLEIGTNHPIHCNNTYFFYSYYGSRGVLVEPDVYFHPIIKKYRSGDVLLTSGIALNASTEADFYVYEKKYRGFSTFSKEEVDVRAKDNVHFIEKIKVPLIDVNSVLEKYFKIPPDFLSVDVEGLDEEILKSLDFEKYGPRIICVEIIRFGQSNFVQNQDSIVEFLIEKGYKLYANTYVNAIFYK